MGNWARLLDNTLRTFQPEIPKKPFQPQKKPTSPYKKRVYHMQEKRIFTMIGGATTTIKAVTFLRHGETMMIVRRRQIMSYDALKIAIKLATQAR